MTREYIKDFDNWNLRKKEINDSDRKLFYHEREVWWSSIGVNVGYEIDGKNENFERPVLVLRKVNKNQFIGLPLTSQDKEGFFYVDARFSDEEGAGKVNISQLRVFSSHRLLRKMDMVKRDDFLNIKKRVVEYILQEDKKSNPASLDTGFSEA
jgi:mRNA interferase MazF